MVWKFLKTWQSFVCAVISYMVGLPVIQEDGSFEWKTMFGVVIADWFMIFCLGFGTCLFLCWMAATLETHWPTIMRWLRKARVWTYRDRLGVMHFGTIHGDLSVRLDNEDNTIKDIQRWLFANKLVASPSATRFKSVLKQASENKRKK